MSASVDGCQRVGPQAAQSLQFADMSAGRLQQQLESASQARQPRPSYAKGRASVFLKANSPHLHTVLTDRRDATAKLKAAIGSLPDEYTQQAIDSCLKDKERDLEASYEKHRWRSTTRSSVFRKVDMLALGLEDTQTQASASQVDETCKGGRGKGWGGREPVWIRLSKETGFTQAFRAARQKGGGPLLPPPSTPPSATSRPSTHAHSMRTPRVQKRAQPVTGKPAQPVPAATLSASSSSTFDESPDAGYAPLARAVRFSVHTPQPRASLIGTPGVRGRQPIAAELAMRPSRFRAFQLHEEADDESSTSSKESDADAELLDERGQEQPSGTGKAEEVWGASPHFQQWISNIRLMMEDLDQSAGQLRERLHGIRQRKSLALAADAPGQRRSSRISLVISRPRKVTHFQASPNGPLSLTRLVQQVAAPSSFSMSLQSSCCAADNAGISNKSPRLHLAGGEVSASRLGHDGSLNGLVRISEDSGCMSGSSSTRPSTTEVQHTGQGIAFRSSELSALGNAAESSQGHMHTEGMRDAWEEGAGIHDGGDDVSVISMDEDEAIELLQELQGQQQPQPASPGSKQQSQHMTHSLGNMSDTYNLQFKPTGFGEPHAQGGRDMQPGLYGVSKLNLAWSLKSRGPTAPHCLPANNLSISGNSSGAQAGDQALPSHACSYKAKGISGLPASTLPPASGTKRKPAMYHLVPHRLGYKLMPVQSNGQAAPGAHRQGLGDSHSSSSMSLEHARISSSGSLPMTAAHGPCPLHREGVAFSAGLLQDVHVGSKHTGACVAPASPGYQPQRSVRAASTPSSGASHPPATVYGSARGPMQGGLASMHARIAHKCTWLLPETSDEESQNDKDNEQFKCTSGQSPQGSNATWGTLLSSPGTHTQGHQSSLKRIPTGLNAQSQSTGAATTALPNTSSTGRGANAQTSLTQPSAHCLGLSLPSMTGAHMPLPNTSSSPHRHPFSQAVPGSSSRSRSLRGWSTPSMAPATKPPSAAHTHSGMSVHSTASPPCSPVAASMSGSASAGPRQLSRSVSKGGWHCQPCSPSRGQQAQSVGFLVAPVTKCN